MASTFSLATKARYTLFISVAVTLVLYNVPQLYELAYPLMLISTLVHEMGHGIAAMLAGGTFHEFHIYSDGSGVALWSGRVGALGQALIAAGGLVGPALGAALCFVLARRTSTARYCLGGLGALLVLAEVLVVRNSFGLVFVGVLAAICVLLALKAGNDWAQLALVFMAVQLALSVYSRSDYLFMKEAHTARGVSASDSQHIAEAIGIAPYWFWGGLCGAFSLVVLVAGALYFLRSERVHRSAR